MMTASISSGPSKPLERNMVIRFKPRKPRLNRGGVSHVLTIIVQIPLLILIIATTVEVGNMLLTQVGLRYAAAATARAAIVWLPTEGSVEQRLERIRLAANQSFAPFASGRDPHVAVAGNDSEGIRLAQQFEQAFQQFAQQKAGSNILQNKFRFARAAMKIEIDVYDDYDPLEQRKRLRSSSGHVVVNYLGREPGKMIRVGNPDIDVRVSYEKPIDLPGVGRFMGVRSQLPNAQFFSHTFISGCSLTIEGVNSTNHRMGVEYDVFQR